ncbi:uncharacterized protein LOC108113126 [Drosophila eugracilis]|uniref:uncharacterized protein LOC108113126 n=1 Tax=Drosophila eugracilis TaxID=29029 RepID=UPI0007E75C5B|nr:uncharacterized protein LOC108113126 [Drosophila eugracilis]
MASRFIVVFSAIIVLAQGSNIIPIEEEAEVAVHSGAPVAVGSQGHPSVYQPSRPIYSHGPIAAPLGGSHRVIGSGLAAPLHSAPLHSAPVVVRPATVVVPAPQVVVSSPKVVVPAPRVVVAPALPLRHSHGLPAHGLPGHGLAAHGLPAHGVAAPVVVASGHGNVHQIRHHGQKPY